MELSKGVLLAGGKYKIEKVLGQGGFGITYLAMSKMRHGGDLGGFDVQVPVAIKEFYLKEICRRDVATGKVGAASDDVAEKLLLFKSKFLKEVYKLAEIHHPNIVKVSDVFEENGTVYYVMQYLQGGTLKYLLEKVRNGQPFDEEQALTYVRQVAEALRYLHEEKQMCHLDVKPENIMIGDQGEAVLIDFGISKSYDEHGQEATRMAGGYSKSFSPIEQYNGALHTFAPQADVYSLGATLYYLLTGKEPPEANMILINKGLGEKPMPSVSDKTWQLLCKAMQPLPQDRIHTMRDFLRMLEGEDISQALSNGSSTLLLEEDERGGEYQGSRTSRKFNLKKLIPFAILVVLVAVAILLIPQFKSCAHEPVEQRVERLRVGDMLYTGIVIDGVPQGKGHADYDDGRSYDGLFVDGKREDKSAQFIYQDKKVFQGEFAADTIKAGQVTTADGNYYFEGTFGDGKPYDGYWYQKEDGRKIVKVTKGQEETL